MITLHPPHRRSTLAPAALFASTLLRSFAAMVILLLTLMTTACGPITFTIGSPPPGEITATTVASDTGHITHRIALIDVTGVIVNAPMPGLLSSSENPVGLLHDKLEAARRDPHVKAVLLRINSPGGTVTASDAMYREVLRFRQLSGKPVITLMADVAASGGYYLACATDHIIAHPTTITASIGVIVQTISVKGTLERIGVSATAITSGPNKDVGSPLSHLTPEHRAILQNLVDDFYSRFTAIVKTARPNIPPDKFAAATDGRIVTGSDALALGLVDATGDLYDAFAAAKKAAKIDRARLILYHRSGSTGPHNVYGEVASSPASPTASAAASSAPAPAHGVTQINLAQFNLNHPFNHDPSMTFLYLWQP